MAVMMEKENEKIKEVAKSIYRSFLTHLAIHRDRDFVEEFSPLRVGKNQGRTIEEENLSKLCFDCALPISAEGSDQVDSGSWVFW